MALWRRLAAPLVLAIVLAGCAGTAPVADPPKEGATLVLVNLTTHAWVITFTPVAGGAPRREEVASRATREVAVAGGRYDVEQAITPGGPVRRLTVTLEPGTRYRWPLATLFSTRAEPGPAAPR